MKKIGLLGLAFGSTNKGCEALGYGFLNVLEKVSAEMQNEFEIHIFERCDVNLIYKNGEYKHLHLKSIPIPGISSISNINTHRNNFRICDYIFDFTAGDSFSDIYGMKRFVQRTVLKRLAEKSGKPFILGSQTYGPYKSVFARLIAKRVINKATAVYARDQLSCNRVKKLTKRDADLTVDVAFAMQYNPTTIESSKIKVEFFLNLCWAKEFKRKNRHETSF